MKKIISILLCVVLMISLAMPVAANEGDAIESENPEVATEEAPEDNTEIGEESSAEDEEDVTEGEKILPEPSEDSLEEPQEDYQVESSAENASYGDYTYTQSNGEITITKYTGATEIVEIPAQIDGMPVTAIGSRAFRNCNSIIKLTIPQGIINIAREAFGNCINLEELYYNCTLEKLGSDIFKGCAKLRTVYLGAETASLGVYDDGTSFGPALETFVVDEKNQKLTAVDGILYWIQQDGTYALALYPVAKDQESFQIPNNTSKLSDRSLCGNPYLKQIVINGEKLTIEKEAMCNLSALEKITFSGEIEALESNIITNCNNLQEIYVETNLPSPKYGISFLDGCDNLSYIRIGKNVNEFPVRDFDDTISCYEVEEGNVFFLSEEGVLFDISDRKTLLKYPSRKAEDSYIIPSDTEKISIGAFNNCVSLQEVVFSPEKTVHIERGTFSGCNNLESIEFSGKVEKVFANAIGSCSNLRTIVWGENLIEWEEIESLRYFTKLSDIKVDSENKKFSSVEGVLFDKNQKTLYVYPPAKGDETYIIPDGVTEIYRDAFADCTYLTAVDVPESVTVIGNNSINSTIIGIRGSEAEKYALENGLPFVDKNQEETSGYPIVPDGGGSVWKEGETEEIIPEDNLYIVNNAAQLAWIAEQTLAGNDFSGKQIVLAADIDLESNEWVPIGDNQNPFRGSFDGKNHKIKNLKVSESAYAGLFGAISSKTATQTVNIRNINLVNVEVSDAAAAGALAGYVRTYKGAGVLVESIIVDGTISGEEAGGAIGFIQGGENGSEITVKNVRSNCDISSSKHGAGIVGRITSGDDRYESYNGSVIVEDCRYNGSVTAPQRNGDSAGIVGEAKAVYNGNLVIRHCRADGKISTDNTGYVGGIAAELAGKNARIVSCVNYAYVTDQGYYGGGIAGGSSGQIEQCYNGGNIIAANQGSVYGGIVGCNEGTIKDSYNLGNIIGVVSRYTYPGGITGNNRGSIENCYHAGTLPEQQSSILTQCYPGAMGSVVIGPTKYCYYDSAAFDIGHLYGNTSKVPDSPLIYNDVGNGIVHSGGMTTMEMKVADSYGPWDFIGVWEFDHEYSWGYPTLISIKDLLDKQPDSEKKNIKNKNGKFTFTVVDQENEEIEGAVIIFGDETQETGESGQAKFNYTEEANSLKVEKEGYVSYEDSNYTMNPTREYRISLVKNGEEGEHPLKSVIMDMRGNRYELLAQTKTINRKYEGVEFKIACTPTDSQIRYTKYEIMQGDQLVAESLTGEFSLTPEIFQTTEKNEVTYETKIRLTDIEGKTSEQKINLIVVDEEEIESSLEFGKGIKFEVGEDVPVFGDSTIEFDTFELPVSVKMSEEKWRVTLNLLDGDWDGGKDDGLKILKSDYSLEKKFEKVKKFLKKESVICRNPKISFDLVGYAEGDMPMGSSDIDLKIYGKMSTKLGKEFQAYTFVFAFDVKGEITATGELILNKDTIQITDGSFKVEPSFTVGLYAGMGMANVLSAGFYGGPKLGMEYYIAPAEEAGLNELYLSGTVKFVVRFLGSNVATHTLWGPKKAWIYARDLDEYKVEESGKLSDYQTAEQWLKSLGDEPIESVDEETAGEWTGNDMAVQQEAYSESKPVYMQADGDIIMLFASNMVTGRNAADSSVLMYSVYDDAADQWLSPKPVDDDGTADFNPVAAGKYVAWNNSKSSLSDCTTLNQIGKLQEVTVAVYNSDTQSFENAQTLTSNQSYENNLQIQETAEGISMSWSTNSQNDVFGMEGDNTLYRCSQEEKKWDIQKVGNVDGMILGKTTGKLDGQPYTAYIVDEDNNLTNREGQAVYLIYSDTGEKQKLTDKSMNAIYSVEEQNKILMIDTEGNIYSKTGKSGEVQQETEDGLVVGRIQQILEDGRGNLTILFTQNEENSANAYAVQFDAKSGHWSDVLEITNSEAYVENISGGYVDGKLMLLYNQREVDVEGSDLNGKNSLMWSTLETGNIQLSDVKVDFYKEDIVSGKEVPLEITVRNTGLTTCKSVDVVFSDETGQIMKQTVEANILPGEEKSIEVLFVVPQLSDKKEIQLEVIPTGNTDSKVSTTFVLGESVYELDRSLYCVNGEYTLVATVVNKGAEKGSGTIEIFDYNNPETVYESFSFTELANDEVLNYDTTINNLNWNEVSYMKLGIRIVKEGKTVGDIRTVDIYRDYQIPVEVLNLNTESVELNEVGQTYRLIASVLPESASNMGVLWKSSNENVVTVNSAGVITAVGEGEAEISALVGDKTAVCKVAVKTKKEIQGDINGDGTVNLVDLMQCLNHVGGKEFIEGEALEAADINEDGIVNLVDLMRLLNYVGGKSGSI